jgi:hypothetical protein
MFSDSLIFSFYLLANDHLNTNEEQTANLQAALLQRCFHTAAGLDTNRLAGLHSVTVDRYLSVPTTRS